MKAQFKDEDLLKKISTLEEQVETYQALIENSSDAFYQTDLEGRITFMSPSVYKLTGFTASAGVHEHSQKWRRGNG